MWLWWVLQEKIIDGGKHCFLYCTGWLKEGEEEGRSSGRSWKFPRINPSPGMMILGILVRHTGISNEWVWLETKNRATKTVLLTNSPLHVSNLALTYVYYFLSSSFRSSTHVLWDVCSESNELDNFFFPSLGLFQTINVVLSLLHSKFTKECSMWLIMSDSVAWFLTGKEKEINEPSSIPRACRPWAHFNLELIFENPLYEIRLVRVMEGRVWEKISEKF